MKRTVQLALLAMTVGPGCAGPSWTMARPVPAASRTVAIDSPAVLAVTHAPTGEATLGTARSLESSTSPPSLANQEVATTTDSAPEPWARFGATAGGVLAAVNSSARIGLPGVGISVDLEELLGLDTGTTTARIESFWRFSENKRHRVDVSWIDLSRRSEATVEQEIDLGNGETIAVGAQLSTRLDLNLLRAAYSYSVFQDDRFDLALSGGLYIAPIDFDVRATGVTSFSSSFGITAPLPVVGMRMDFAITPRWYLRTDLNVFYLEFSGFKGGITSSTSALEYRPWDHVSFVLGVDSFKFAVEANGSTSIPGINQTGSVDFGYTGLLLYIKTLW